MKYSFTRSIQNSNKLEKYFNSIDLLIKDQSRIGIVTGSFLKNKIISIYVIDVV